MTRTSHREKAYEFIRAKVLAGEIQAGERLSEVPLAREIGISRTPVREAMHQLASEGLLERGDGGVTVRIVTLAEMDEIARLRMLLEPHAAARAAKLITPEQLDRLTSLFQQLRNCYRELRDADRSQWRGRLGRQLSLADMLFHTAILEAACSPRLMKTVIDLRLLTTRPRTADQMTLHDLARFLREHWRIFRAIRDHNSRAARRAMREHQRAHRRSIRRYMQIELQRGESGAMARDWTAVLRRIIDPPVRKASK